LFLRHNAVGGADAHRVDLSSMIMIKDNHIAAHGLVLLFYRISFAGSIAEAVKAAKKLGGFSLKVEVECENTKEAFEAIGLCRVHLMLD
jgi:nicotinate-nucleotide pyrophosphorylase (carboxylating)